MNVNIYVCRFIYLTSKLKKTRIDFGLEFKILYAFWRLCITENLNSDATKAVDADRLLGG